MVRRVAARALCQIGDARAAGPIFRALYAGDYWLFNTVLRTGGILRIPGVRDELLRIVKEDRRDYRYWAIQALRHAADWPASIRDCATWHPKHRKRVHGA